MRPKYKVGDTIPVFKLPELLRKYVKREGADGVKDVGIEGIAFDAEPMYVLTFESPKGGWAAKSVTCRYLDEHEGPWDFVDTACISTTDTSSPNEPFSVKRTKYLTADQFRVRSRVMDIIANKASEGHNSVFIYSTGDPIPVFIIGELIALKCKVTVDHSKSGANEEYIHSMIISW